MRRRPLLAALPLVPAVIAGAARAEGELVDIRRHAFSTSASGSRAAS